MDGLVSLGSEVILMKTRNINMKFIKSRLRGMRPLCRQRDVWTEGWTDGHCGANSLIRFDMKRKQTQTVLKVIHTEGIKIYFIVLSRSCHIFMNIRKVLACTNFPLELYTILYT